MDSWWPCFDSQRVDFGESWRVRVLLMGHSDGRGEHGELAQQPGSVYHLSVAPSFLGRAVWRNCWGTTAARRLTCQKVFDLLDVQSQNRIRQGGTSDSPCLAAKITQDLHDTYVRTGLWLIMDQFWRIKYIKIWSICPSMMFSLNQVVVVWRRGPWGIIESD